MTGALYRLAHLCIRHKLVVVVAGETNWWMPRFLEPVVPQLNIEGAEFFDAHDAERV